MSTPIPHPSQNGRKRFPAWRRQNGLISASDEELEWESEWFERWALRSAGILIVGLLTELAQAFFDPPHTSDWGRWGPFWATLIVVAGVWGEVAFARMGARRSEELTRRSKKRAAEANERAAEAQLELERLRSPRTLSQAQQKELTARLAKFERQIGTIGAAPALPESVAFALMLGGSLSSWTGWDIKMRPSDLTFARLSTGVVVLAAADKPSAWDAAKALVGYLNEVGISASFHLPNEADPMHPTHTIRITVSTK
jgi:hypothetical protein